MYEVELKVEADHEAVRERLSAVGARRLGSVVQVDTYYDAPHRDFGTTDEALRVRRETDEGGEFVARVTYKGPLVEAASKTREERETAVADGDAMAAILEAVGFTPVTAVRKERTRYELDGYTVALDRVDDVGEFVEVETEADDSGTEAGDDAIETAREGAYDLLRRLGLDPDDQVRTSYLELLLDE